MNAKQKIEGLTRSWYGYSVFAALLSDTEPARLERPFAPPSAWEFSIVLNAIVLVVADRVPDLPRTQAREPGERDAHPRDLLGRLFCVLGTLSTLTAGRGFLHEWSLATVQRIVLRRTSSTMLNARSFRVLTETSVRAYFV